MFLDLWRIRCSRKRRGGIYNADRLCVEQRTPELIREPVSIPVCGVFTGSFFCLRDNGKWMKRMIRKIIDIYNLIIDI